MSFIHQVIDNSRLLNVLYDNLDKEITLNPNYQKLCAYLSGYLEFNKVSVDQATEVYTRFISSYNKDCRQFIKTNRYPYELNPEIVKISREDYDIILLFSVLFSPHRFRIMELIHENNGTGKALYIGLGPGLELLYTQTDFAEKIAYDLAVNPFLNKQFPEVKLNHELYTGQNPEYFDSIYMIELLEHVPDPFQLVKIAYTSLKVGGKVLFTTASNIPQFDHVYNFSPDHTEFESKLQEMGFNILFKEKIEHNYITLDLNSSNHFYVIEKTK
jgi:hypothetical protein